MAWKDIATAPKDGKNIVIKTVSGTNKDNVLYNGDANWRSEDKEALVDPISGNCFANKTTITGWMRSDSPYRVPGVTILWKEK